MAHALWKRDMMKGGGFAFLPLNPGSAFEDGWELITGPAADAPRPCDERVTVVDDLLVIHAVGAGENNMPGKIGCDSVAGWLAYAREDRLFLKSWEPSPPSRGHPYTVEIWFQDGMCELEPLSPWVELAPGGKAELNERWRILPLSAPCRSARQAVALRDVVEALLAESE